MIKINYKLLKKYIKNLNLCESFFRTNIWEIYNELKYKKELTKILENKKILKKLKRIYDKKINYSNERDKEYITTFLENNFTLELFLAEILILTNRKFWKDIDYLNERTNYESLYKIMELSTSIEKYSYDDRNTLASHVELNVGDIINDIIHNKNYWRSKFISKYIPSAYISNLTLEIIGNEGFDRTVEALINPEFSNIYKKIYIPYSMFRDFRLLLSYFKSKNTAGVKDLQFILELTDEKLNNYMNFLKTYGNERSFVTFDLFIDSFSIASFLYKKLSLFDMDYFAEHYLENFYEYITRIGIDELILIYSFYTLGIIDSLKFKLPELVNQSLSLIKDIENKTYSEKK